MCWCLVSLWSVLGGGRGLSKILCFEKIFSPLCATRYKVSVDTKGDLLLVIVLFQAKGGGEVSQFLMNNPELYFPEVPEFSRFNSIGNILKHPWHHLQNLRIHNLILVLNSKPPPLPPLFPPSISKPSLAGVDLLKTVILEGILYDKLFFYI